jgi:hypothetical protein
MKIKAFYSPLNPDEKHIAFIELESVYERENVGVENASVGRRGSKMC